MKKLVIGGVVLAVALIGWVIYQGFKPLPGTVLEDLGRKHIDVGSAVDYNSNPPTSGPHYLEWIKKGIYDIPQDDRNLVHSLEHGYVIMSYNCDYKPTSWYPIKKAYAHEELEVTDEELSATLSASQSSAIQKTEECAKFVDQLHSIYDKKGDTKLIIIVRPELDSRLALTAWTRLDKWNPDFTLSDSDKKRIENFIDAFRNKGPEATMEP